jgi:hypothetical protein
MGSDYFGDARASERQEVAFKGDANSLPLCFLLQRQFRGRF